MENVRLTKFYHIICGLRSGIPECCVKFYLTEWQEMNKRDKNNYLAATKRWSYIPCNKCKDTKHIAELKECHCVGYSNPVCLPEGGDDATTFKFKDKGEESIVRRVLDETEK